jgi:DNA-binding response OmpR family regulator
MSNNTFTGRVTPAQTGAAPAPVVVGRVRPATILMVDGRMGNFHDIRLVFGGLGYEIVRAADVRAALEQVAACSPDLILLDFGLPGEGECGFCRQLKANSDWKDIPVIFLSAVDDKEMISRALNDGGADYITKPFSRAELISRVRTHLALKASLDRLKELAQEKEELIEMLAHSLKNYLGGINLSADLMRGRSERLKDVRLRQLAEQMIDSSASALALVKNFLGRAAVDHGSIPRQQISALPGGTVVVQEQRARKSARRKRESGHGDFSGEPVSPFGASLEVRPKAPQSGRISA